MKVVFPKAYAYLSRFREALGERRDAVLMRSKESIPFYAIGAVSEYTFAPYKVVWGRIASRMDASVVSTSEGRVVIPQETISLVGCDEVDEAHYICATLNSSPFNFSLQSYSQKGGKSFGTPSILENVCVPKYDLNNPTHLALGDLSQQAHAATAAGDAARVREIEAEVDRLAAQLWGLTDAELREIQESLTELG